MDQETCKSDVTQNFYTVMWHENISGFVVFYVFIFLLENVQFIITYSF